MARHRPSQLERIAYHEAGHAVAAFETGVSIRRVTIVPGREYRGRVFQRALSKSFREKVSAGPQTRERIRLENLIIVRYAGAMAEKVAFGRVDRWVGKNSDMNGSADLLTHLADDEKEQGAYANWLWERTRVLISYWATWPGVEALARELLQSRTIKGPLAREIFRKARREAGKKAMSERLENASYL